MKTKKPKNDDELFVHSPTVAYSTKPISIHEAKTNFSKLVKRAAAGETIYIGAYGKPEVTLTVVDQRKINAKLRAEAFGCMKGKMVLPEGWDDPIPDEIIDIMMYSMQGLEDWDHKPIEKK